MNCGDNLIFAEDLKGKVIWITGASTGIGAALGEEAVKHGAKLVLTARSLDKLQDVKKKCLGAVRLRFNSDVYETCFVGL